jgi:hypothetical protein
MFRTLVEVIGLAGTLFAGFWAVLTYSQSLKLQRARWVKELYEKFYEHSELKKVRNLVDSNDLQQIHSMVEKEDPAFTDYLNFFEFLGILWDSKQISKKEILDLFDYYLRILRKDEKIAAYIADPAKGFEKLRKMLKMVEEATRK